MKRLLAVAGSIVALFAVAATASAESADRYLHSIAMPPKCAFAWNQPDPSLSVCWVSPWVDHAALASQSLILAVGDFEATREDCESWRRQTMVFTVDGSPVPITTQPCREVSRSIDNVITLPFFGADTVWGASFRYLIPAGSMSLGVHTFTATSTYTSDYSYTLGCDDPSGRCTVPAGTVASSTSAFTIIE